MNRAKLLEANLRAVRKNIFALCRALNFDPTWQQRELLELVQRGDKKIAVKSGQGPGKTTCSGVIGLYQLLRRTNAMGIVTAPTMRQCREVWLAEVKRTLQRADPWLRRLIKTTASEVRVAGHKLWSIKLVTATSPEQSQGFHAEDLFVICEEASGVPRELITQYKGTLSNPGAFFLMIGNPNTRDCVFYDCFNSQRDKWACLTFNAEETPKSRWFDPKRNLELEEEFGRNSDVYRVRVLGEFPHVDPNCVMSSEDLDPCAKPGRRLICVRQSSVKQFGIDFARFGGDENVIVRRAGNAALDLSFWAHMDPGTCVDQAFRMQEEAGWRNNKCRFVVDASGMGQGVLHRFYNAEKKVFEFHNGSTAMKPRRYANKITEAWFEFAQRCRRGEAYFPNDNILIQQLTARQYSTDRKGRLILESKDQFMKRGHKSPDRADAIVYAFYDHVQLPKGSVSRPRRGSKTVGRV